MRLEPLEPRHEDALWEVAQDARAWRWMRVRGDESREASTSGSSRIELGFAHYFDGELVGHTSYLNVRDRTTASVEIGNTWLNPRAWGTGANTEAKLPPPAARVRGRGLPARRVQDGCGERRARVPRLRDRREFEGVFRKHMLVRGGERRDSAWYAVIDDDWPAYEGSVGGAVLFLIFGSSCSGKSDPSRCAPQASSRPRDPRLRRDPGSRRRRHCVASPCERAVGATCARGADAGSGLRLGGSDAARRAARSALGIPARGDLRVSTRLRRHRTARPYAQPR